MRAKSHMKAEWRPLGRGELDHERLWLMVSAAGGVCAGAAWQLGVRPPPCLFHLVTGIPCPGCGSTRAILQLVQGHVAAALFFNPLATLAAFLLAVYCVYAALVLVFGWPRLRLSVPGLWGRLLRAAILAAIAANWWWVIAHGM